MLSGSDHLKGWTLVINIRREKKPGVCPAPCPRVWRDVRGVLIVYAPDGSVLPGRTAGQPSINATMLFKSQVVPLKMMMRTDAQLNLHLRFLVHHGIEDSMKMTVESFNSLLTLFLSEADLKFHPLQTLYPFALKCIHVVYK